MIRLLIALACIAVFLPCRHAAGLMGTETFGNEPLNGANYAECPGSMPIVNHEDRVYHFWVNGHEQFFSNRSRSITRICRA